MNEFIIVVGACLAGCSLGVLTGLTPGIHVNTLLPFLVGFSVSGRVGAVLIFSLAVTHTFLDFIPSTLFGVPDTNTALSVLPAHRLLLSGRGYEAIKLTVVGSLGALLVSCALVLPMISLIPVLYEILLPHTGYILLSFVIFIILSEKSLKKMILSSCVFLLSGAYGCIVLSSPLVAEDLILFPVFCGLFGLSTLLISLRSHGEFPPQSMDSKIQLTSSDIFKNVVKGSAAGILVSLFPGVGPAHAATVISVKSSPRKFLIAVSGVNTANTVYALVSLYTVGKARSGAVVAIQDLIHLDGKTLGLLLSCGLIAAGIASVTALGIARKILDLVSNIDYKALMGATCFALVLIVGVITGFTGLLIMGVGVSIGILPPFLHVHRSHCMGVLLLPILLYYLRLGF